MEWVRRLFHGVGPVILGAFLLAAPILFTPEPVQASSSECGGYDTVECSTLEWCLGAKYFGMGLCVTSVSYYPPVVIHVREALEDQMDINLWEGMGDYVHGTPDGGGGGGTF
ncbi:MAG: hypothetical protein R3223_00655 [Longimicrobiales bacterium]|nr:hypothetical protein [Longimicrobiales bacterium]